MKIKNFTSFLIWICFAQISFSQNINSDFLTNLSNDSEVIVEGRIIKDSSFLDPTNGTIYTEIFLETSRIFKGENEKVSFIIHGGQLPNGRFMSFSHSVKLHGGIEGIFFLKPFPISGRSDLMLNGSNAIYYYSKLHAPRATNGVENLSISQIINKLSQLSPKSYKHLLKNSFEVDFTLKSEKDLLSTQSTPILTYTFNNFNVQNDSIEFDVYVSTNMSNVKFYSSEIYMNYGNSIFGENIYLNGNFDFERGIVIESPNYNLDIDDFNDSTVVINAYSNQTTNLYSLSQYNEKIAHFKFSVEDYSEVAVLGMDFGLMSEQSYYYDTVQDTILPFARVDVVDELFPYQMPKITHFEGSYSGDEILTAGTGEILIIEGDNFGNIKGDIQMVDVDKSDLSIPTIHVETIDPSLITTWSDDYIEVKLETEQFIQGGPIFFVITDNLNFCNSLDNTQTELYVRYSCKNVQNVNTNNNEFLYNSDSYFDNNLQGPHGDGESDGIFEFTVSDHLNLGQDEINAIEEALCDWTDEIDVQWTLRQQISNQSSIIDPDQLNLILYNDGSLFFGDLAYADMSTKTEGAFLCDYLGTDNDILFDGGENIIIRKDPSQNPNNPNGLDWNFDGNPSSNELDFKSWILHELGHCLNLNHTYSTCGSCGGDPELHSMHPVPARIGLTKDIHYADRKGGDYELETALDFYDDLDQNESQCLIPIELGHDCLPNSTHSETKHNEILVYPSLVENHNLNIENDHQSDLYRIQFHSTTGQKVGDFDQFLEFGKNSLQINYRLEPGYYLLSISNNNFHGVYKILII